MHAVFQLHDVLTFDFTFVFNVLTGLLSQQPIFFNF